eukprot:TRINITY_DN52398_c0_g1_i1.p1 TRINITY_DN52398_c0_g1~~TRINITY_DN52398_c0_g1_i1.p1  ORF type:complete len:147 (-),score=31.41 TRINITY_DN52398_c0_g1_i1:205-645(-)
MAGSGFGLRHHLYHEMPSWFSSFVSDMRDASEAFNRDVLQIEGCTSSLARCLGGGADMEQALMGTRSALKPAQKAANGEVFTVGRGSQEHTVAIYNQAAQNAVKHLKAASDKLTEWQDAAEDAADPPEEADTGDIAAAAVPHPAPS